jgi:hypothetical protein
MPTTRLCTLFLATSMLASPAFAKDETLADRGRRMCEDAGIALSDCRILPPKDRVAAARQTLQAAHSPRSLAAAVPFGTGKYGWCADCTSLFGAAPIEPWSRFAGRTYSPPRDEDDRTTVADGTGGGAIGTGAGGAAGGGAGGDTGKSGRDTGKSSGDTGKSSGDTGEGAKGRW